MKLTLKVWRQNGPRSQGHFETHEMPEVSEDMSFLEVLDAVNEDLIERGDLPASIVLVLATRPGVQAIERARDDTPVSEWLLPHMHRRTVKAGEQLVVSWERTGGNISFHGFITLAWNTLAEWKTWRED